MRVDENAVRASELLEDPLGRGYSSMSDQEAADSLNVVNRTRIRASMSGDEFFQATDEAEFMGLTDAKRALWLSFCARAAIDPGAAASTAFVKFIFGAGSATVSALATRRTEVVSRAIELGIRSTAGLVEDSRAA